MEKKIYGIIYLLIDGTNDLEYVGQTIRSVKARFKQHAREKRPTYISRAIRAHGAENFVIAILKVCYSKEDLDYWEKHFIKYRNTLSPNGYNLTEGGEGGIPCDEIRAKIGAKGKGIKKSPEHRAKIAAAERGKKQTPEARAKIAVAHIGKSLTEATRRKLISIARRAKTSYKNLIAEMNKYCLSYKGLAEILEVTKAAVSAKMRGKLNFTEKDKAKLVEIFDKPIEYLMKRDDE